MLFACTVLHVRTTLYTKGVLITMFKSSFMVNNYTVIVIPQGMCTSDYKLAFQVELET
jgi:hypothetical protein